MTTAYLLGTYPGNRHISIENYLDYCQQELPPHLPGWNLKSARPGKETPYNYLTRPTSRGNAWSECYCRWPAKLLSLKAELFHIVDQGISWYRMFLNAGKVVVTVHDLINALTVAGDLKMGEISRRRSAIVQASMAQIKKADAIICVSQNTADAVIRLLGISSSRIHVIANVVASDFFEVSEIERTSRRQSLGMTPEELLVIHVGKASAYKNRIGALRAFALLLKRLPCARMIVTGDLLSAEEQSFVNEQGCVERVSVQLLKSRSELRLLYGAADLLLFPSLYEGFGWPPLEAMACGCPVIASRGGALPEVVGSAGITIEEPNDTEAFTQAAHRVLTDEKESNRLRAEGLRRARLFSPEHIFPQLADVYRSLVHN